MVILLLYEYFINTQVLTATILDRGFTNILLFIVILVIKWIIVFFLFCCSIRPIQLKCFKQDVQKAWFRKCFNVTKQKKKNQKSKKIKRTPPFHTVHNKVSNNHLFARVVGTVKEMFNSSDAYQKAGRPARDIVLHLFALSATIQYLTRWLSPKSDRTVH